MVEHYSITWSARCSSVCGIVRPSAFAEMLGEVLPTPLKRLGVQGFGESGDAKGLYAKHGLDPAGIAGSVRKFLNR